MDIAAPAPAVPFLGRRAEIELLTALLDGIHSAGSALVFCGAPGIGKSRLLAEAARLARGQRVTVLGTNGVQTETHLAFAGVHQLVRPIRDRTAHLPAAHRASLDAAFGLTDAAAPEQFRIAMAILDLLCDVAAEAPLLVTVDDAHQLDQPSAAVLAFVARRIEADHIALLVATRDRHPGPLTDAGLPEHRLAPLNPAAATELLAATAPRLTAAARSRVLRESAGNPLAIIELPHAGPPQPLPGQPLPLTDRLQQTFAARVADLPESTRWLLLAAAVDDEQHLAEVLRAGSLAAGTQLHLEDLQPAAEAAIIDLDVQTMHFRHPLMRSAVLQAASTLQHRRTHEALAATLAQQQPERAIWHRAALLAGVHEDVAGELAAAGEQARRRGAVDIAAAALRRAAELSEPATRTARLLTAAGLALRSARATRSRRCSTRSAAPAPGPSTRLARPTSR